MKKGLLSSILGKSPDIPRPVRDRLVAVMESDLATDLLNKHEQDRLAKRAQLAKRLAELPKQHEKTIADAGKRAQEALQAHEKALQAARKAMEAMNEASTLSYGAQLQMQYQVGAVERELLESADPRINDFILQINLLEGAARLRHEFWVEPIKLMGGGYDKKYHSNTEQVKKAGDLLAELKANCRTMQLQAISRAEVESRFMEMIDQLEPVLAPLDLRPMRLEDGEVLVPHAMAIANLNSAPHMLAPSLSGPH